MAGEVGSIFVRVGAETSGFNRGMGQVDSRLRGFRSRLGTAMKMGGLAVAGFGVVAGGALIKTGIQFASMKEQAQIAFTTMLGSGKKAKKFLDELEAFAAKTPFEFPDLLKASQRLLAMGFEAKKIPPMMTRIGDTVAALGGGAFEIDRVTRALGQMSAKGKVQAEEMMQLTELGIPAWKMLADALGVDVATAMEKVTRGEVDAKLGIDAILEGMGRFEGMMDKQSRTLAGLWSTTKDLFRSLAGDIMSAALPALKDALGWLNKFMDRFKDAEGARAKLQVIWDALSEIGGKIRDVLGKIDWGNVFGTIGEGLVKVVGAINWKAVASAVFDGLKGLSMSIGKGLWAAMGFNEEELRRAACDTFFAIAEGIGEAGGYILDAIAGVTSAFGDFLAWMGGVSDAMKIPNPFGEWAQKADAAAKSMHEMAGRMKDMKHPLEVFKDKMKDAAEAQDSFSQALENSPIGQAEKALEGFTTSVSRVEAATVVLTSAFGRVPSVKEIRAFLKDDEARAAMDKLADKVTKMPGKKDVKANFLSEEAQRLADKLISKIRAIPDKSKTDISVPGAVDSREKADAVTAAVKRIPDFSRTSISTPGSFNAVSALGNVRDAVYRIPTSWSVTVTTFLRTVGTAFTFQHGGVSPGGMALVGEAGPELVGLPRGARVFSNPQSRRMMSDAGVGALAAPGGGMLAPVVNVYVTLDGRDIAATVRAEQIRTGRRNPTVFSAAGVTA